MKQFLEVVRETKSVREKVESALEKSNKSFALASAVTSPKVMTEALMLPKKEVSLEISEKNVMSVVVPVFTFDLHGAAQSDGYNFGFAFTSGEIDSAVDELSKILPDMVKLAELEKDSQLMAEEIEKTRRRVNALEHVMIPQIEETIKSITMKLDENERGNLTRLMKVKDMMIKQQMEKRT
jgi:V/A-type H+-transporting ATPase subunit D